MASKKKTIKKTDKNTKVTITVEMDELPQVLHTIEGIVKAKPTHVDKNVARMRKKSGEVNDSRLLVGFLYLLMRDQVTPGRIEAILLQLCNEHDIGSADVPMFDYTNGWIAAYCQDVADRLLLNKTTLKDIDPDSSFEYNRFKK